VDVFFPDARKDGQAATATIEEDRPADGAPAVADVNALVEAPTTNGSPQVNGTAPAQGAGARGDEVGGATDGASTAGESVASGGAGANGTPASAAGAVVERAGSAASLPDLDGLVPVPGARFAELPVHSIRPNPRQPRTVFDEDALDELVGSIREIGVLQPVVVRSAGDGYELIMGERRWRATQAAGLDTIPAIIRDTEDSDLLRDALLENLHRSQLNPLEEAAAYQQLLDDFGCTHEQLATRIHRSRPQISNTLRLLKLPPLVQRRVAAGVLSAGHARALLGLNDGAAIERLAQRIVSEGLSVRAVEEIVSLGVDDAAPVRRARPRAGERNEALDSLAARLSDRFETRVKVSLGKSRGRLTVEFASVQDLNRILESLAPEDPGLLKG
jgi:ParB family chromosome partitioning protein